jgi:hypothetical protein
MVERGRDDVRRGPELDAEHQAVSCHAALTNPQMDERTFELYRLSVVLALPDSELKSAIMGAIRHKLHVLDAWTLAPAKSLYTTGGHGSI